MVFGAVFWYNLGMKKFILISLVLAILGGNAVVFADEMSDFTESVNEGVNGAPDVEAIQQGAEQNQQAVKNANRLGGTLIPKTDKSIDQCFTLLRDVNVDLDSAKSNFVKRDDAYVGDVLGCAIKTGDIKFWMVPYYVRYILEFIVQLGALAAVGGIVYGGYLYMFAGISEDKDKGKTAIMYSVAGIVVMAVAWAVVNVFISFFI